MALLIKNQGVDYCDHPALARAIDGFGAGTMSFLFGLKHLGNCSTLAGDYVFRARLAKLPMAMAVGPALNSSYGHYEWSPSHASAVSRYHRYEPTSFGKILAFSGSADEIRRLSDNSDLDPFSRGEAVAEYVRSHSIPTDGGEMAKAPDFPSISRKVWLKFVRSTGIHIHVSSNIADLIELIKSNKNAVSDIFGRRDLKSIERMISSVKSGLQSYNEQDRQLAFECGARLLTLCHSLPASSTHPRSRIECKFDDN